MANEITVSISGQIAIGTSPYNLAGEVFPGGQAFYDSSTSLADKVVKSIPTSDTNLTALLPNTSTIEGFLYVKNLDSTNYVKLGPTAAAAIVPMIRLNPGKVALIPLEPGLTLRAQANTAACKCDIRLYSGNGAAGA